MYESSRHTLDSIVKTNDRAYTLDAEGDGARVFMATTISSQKNAVKQLREHGFKVISTFRNVETKNTVTIWLRKPRK